MKKIAIAALASTALVIALSFNLPLASAAPTVCQIGTGCTGTSTSPTFGKVLIGGRNGEYEFVASSTFQAAAGNVTSVFGRLGAITAQTGDYTTSLVPEGSNLYYTLARWASALAGTTTDALREGVSNLYWTNTRFDNRLAATTSLPSIVTLAALSLPLSQTTGTLPVANGGTASTTLTGILKGNGTSQVKTAVGDTDYQKPISLTTSGTSGAATFSGDILNIPQYAGATYSAAWPITLAGSVFGFNGLATTSPWTANSLAYVVNGNTLASIATSSLNLTTSSFKSSNVSQWTNDAGYLTSLAGAASSTLLTDGNTFSGINKFTNALSDFGGTWQTFSPSHFQIAGSYLTAAPVGTSSNETAGQIAYWTTTNGTPAKLGGVATSTLTPSSPLTGSFTHIGSGGSLGCQIASGSQAGCIATADWTAFNGKISSSSLSAIFPIAYNPATGAFSFNGLATTSPWNVGEVSYVASGNGLKSVATSTLTASSPLTGSFTHLGSTGSLGCQTATGSQAGCLSAANWTTFNGKQDALAFSWPLVNTANTISFNGLSTSTAAVVGNIPYFSGVNTFANVATGTISASSPLSVTANRYTLGGSAAFSITKATSGADGYLTSADWTVFNSKVGSSSLSGSSPITYSPTTGVIACPTCSTGSSFAYPFTNDATSTLLSFNGGLNAAMASTFTGNVVIATSTQDTKIFDTSGSAYTQNSGNVTGAIDLSGSLAINTTGNHSWIRSSPLLTLNNNMASLTSFNNNLTVGGTGNVTTLIGNSILPTSQGSYSGLITTYRAYSASDWATSPNKLTNAIYFYGTAANSASSSAGLLVDALTSPKSNASIVLGQATIPTSGNFGIYENTGYQNYFASNTGIATTTPGSLLSIGNTGGINFTTATSTFSTTGGINIVGGCYAVNGACLSTGGSSSFAYPFPSDATSTKLSFSSGLLALASSTIGNGTQNGGLTIDGGATTTGNAYFAGTIGVGTVSPLGQLDVESTSAGTRGIAIGQISSNAAGANLNISKSRGAVGALTTVANNDFIGAPLFNAYDGTSYLGTAGFGARVNGTVTTGSVPTDLFFFATSTDQANPYTTGGGSIRLMLASNGNVGVSSTTPGSLFSVGNTGGINFNLATSTFATTGGINLTGGCFAVNGTCLSSGGAGTVMNVATTYPVTGGPITNTGTIGLAFGTTTSNTWAGTQTITNAPIFSTLSGVLLGNSSSAVTAASTQTCTNQFVRAMSNAYIATCAAVNLASDVTGTLPAANGGTGATSLAAGLSVVSNALSQVEHRSFTYATSTWIGTTTIPIESGYGEVWNSIRCFTDAGTVSVNLYHNASHLDFIRTASTTNGTFTFTTNNTMTDGDKVNVDIGTPVSNPTKITCTAKDTI